MINGTGIGLLIEGGDASVLFNGVAPVDFSTSLTTYIRLATNGTTVPSASINAQSVKFGGADGTTMAQMLSCLRSKIRSIIKLTGIILVSFR
ncbi:MAG: hypothetical protein R3A12_09970 [Ignavibacteria bacterium]